MNDELSLFDSWRSLTILVLGDVMLDCYLHGKADRLCQEAPVPVVAVHQQHEYPGGAANVAANIASLGGGVLLMSVIGNDVEGDRLQKTLRKRGISTGYLISNSERKTLAKHRVMADSHLLVRFDQGNTNAIHPELEQEVIDQLITLYPICDAVIISDYDYGTLTPRLIQQLADVQSGNPKPLMVDSKKLAAYQQVRVTAVKPNYSQTIQLLQLPHQSEQRVNQICSQGDRLLQLTGATIAIVTLDREGAVIFERDASPIHCQTTPVPTNQTSGAGDTFISAFTLALTAGTSTSTAISLAMKATETVVQQIGTTTCPVEQLKQKVVGQSIQSATY